MSSPAFGKRNVVRSAARPAAGATQPDHAAFFAAARATLAEAREERAVVVPRAFKAAFLAGLIVGCALAGFDVTGSAGAQRVQMVEQLIGVRVDTSGFVPVLILIGLLNGARMAALMVIGVYTLLAALGETRRSAYTLGGAAASVALCAACQALGHPIGHGWPIDALAGAGAGFLYRILAGARPARPAGPELQRTRNT